MKLKVNFYVTTYIFKVGTWSNWWKQFTRFNSLERSGWCFMSETVGQLIRPMFRKCLSWWSQPFVLGVRLKMSTPKISWIKPKSSEMSVHTTMVSIVDQSWTRKSFCKPWQMFTTHWWVVIFTKHLCFQIILANLGFLPSSWSNCSCVLPCQTDLEWRSWWF